MEDVYGMIMGFILVVFFEEIQEKEKLAKIKLEELYKTVEKSIEVLKKMPSESSLRLNRINKYLKDNIDSIKENGLSEGDNHDAIFNPELKLKLKMIVQQQFFFPTIISSEIRMLSGFVNDGITLLSASVTSSWPILIN